MNANDTIKLRREPGDSLPETGTDMAAVAALTDEQVHAAALADPDARPLAEDGSGIRRLVNVKKLRERLGLTQEEFATRYRIPPGTVRDWEQRRKLPDAAARAFLLVIERDPDGVAALLKAA